MEIYSSIMAKTKPWKAPQFYLWDQDPLIELEIHLIQSLFLKLEKKTQNRKETSKYEMKLIYLF